MKDILNRYQNIKPEKRKIILLISLLIITISVTYAFFAPLIGEGVTTNINTQTGLTDDLYFESGNTLSITADQYNFAEGKGNITDETTASAYLRANTGNKTATQYYEVYFNIINNGFKYTSGSNAELILNVYTPDGNEITTLGALQYKNCGELNGYDITDAIGKIPIKEINEIISDSSDTYTIHDWKFVVTFLNRDWDQSENSGKSFEAEIIMEHTEKLDPVMAIYSEDDSSLRFYNYDETAVVGGTFNNLAVSQIFTGLEYTDFYWYNSNIAGGIIKNISWADIRTDIRSVIVVDDITVKNTRNWFFYVDEATYFNLEKLDTSEVVDMSFMFAGIGYTDTLTIEGLEDWDTSKVSNMEAMFGDSLGEYVDDSMFSISDISNWDTSNVTNMKEMFFDMLSGYDAEVSLGDIGKWDTSNVRNMESMFYLAGENSNYIWYVGDLGKWDVGNVTNMNSIFMESWESADHWTVGDLSNWDTSNVTDMAYMFELAGENSRIWTVGDLSNWDTSNVTRMDSMFDYIASKATTFNIGDIGKWDVSNVTDMSYMFSSTAKNASTWNIGDLSNWDVSNVTYMNSMFSYTAQNASSWSVGDLSNWDVSNVINMASMFYSAGKNATNWSVGDLSNWNTSKVTNMKSMFKNAGINAQYTLDLGAWDSSEVINYTDFNTGVESKIIPPVWVN